MKSETAEWVELLTPAAAAGLKTSRVLGRESSPTEDEIRELVKADIYTAEWSQEERERFFGLSPGFLGGGSEVPRNVR